MTELWLSTDDINPHLGATKDIFHTWTAYKKMRADLIGQLWKFQAGEIDDRVHSGDAEPSDEAIPS